MFFCDNFCSKSNRYCLPFFYISVTKYAFSKHHKNYIKKLIIRITLTLAFIVVYCSLYW